MAIKTKIDWLKDRFGNITIPKTLTKAIYDDDGKQLNTKITEIDDEIASIHDDMSNKADVDDMSTKEITGHASGINPHITDSASAPLFSNKMSGYLIQKKYHGHNLFKVTAITNAYDGAEVGVIDNSVVTIRGTTTSVVDVVLGSCTLQPGDYIFSGCELSSLDMAYLDFGGIASVYNGEQVVTLTEEKTFDVKLHAESGKTFANLVFYPMIRLASSEYSDFEPYVGGIPSPNPSYPQRIGGLGDKGYFDGILLQGSYISDTGIYREDGTYVCNKNRIKCSYQDLIELIYEEDIREMHVLFYDINGTFISSTYVGDGTTKVNYLSVNAPYGAEYFCFDIGDPISGFSLTYVKHICVRVNNKYIAEYRTSGKNILDFKKYDFIHYHSITYSIEDDIVVFTPTDTNDPYLGEAIIKGESIANGKHVIDVRGASTVTITVSNTDFSKNYYTPFDKYKKSLGYHVFTSGVPIELPEGTEYINVRIGMQNGELKEYRTTIQIEKGSEATSYEKYHEVVASVPITSPLYDGDYIKINADGSGKLVRTRGSIIYDGVNRKFTGKSSTTNNIAFYDSTVPNCAVEPNRDAVSDVYCNRMISCAYYDIFSKSYIGICYDYGKTGELRFGFGMDSELTTLELANEWLKTTNLRVVYRLATPTEEDLTSDQIAQLIKLYTFEGVTNINCGGEAEVLYFRNTTNGNAFGSMYKLLQNEARANI